MKKRVKIILTIIAMPFVLILLLFIIRMILPKELDDLHPLIPCEQELIKKSDIIWVIPLFDNQSISDNSDFCNYFRNLNKTFGMHGVYHNWEEMNTPRSRDYLLQGIIEFEKCFGYRPTMFKPPQMEMIKENHKPLKELSLKIRTPFSQLTHKAFHCNDTGILSNRFNELF